MATIADFAKNSTQSEERRDDLGASTMAKEALLRQKRFEAAEQARKVALIEATITSFERMGANLAFEIAAEEERTRIRDPNHVAYSTLAKATALRRRNLLISTADLKSKLDAARRELDDASIRLRAAEEATSPTPSAAAIETSPGDQNSAVLSVAS
jgi:flagellar FliJ protein